MQMSKFSLYSDDRQRSGLDAISDIYSILRDEAARTNRLDISYAHALNWISRKVSSCPVYSWFSLVPCKAQTSKRDNTDVLTSMNMDHSTTQLMVKIRPKLISPLVCQYTLFAFHLSFVWQLWSGYHLIFELMSAYAALFALVKGITSTKSGMKRLHSSDWI